MALAPLSVPLSATLKRLKLLKRLLQALMSDTFSQQNRYIASINT